MSGDKKGELFVTPVKTVKQGCNTNSCEEALEVFIRGRPLKYLP